jgi:hypothetical protein
LNKTHAGIVLWWLSPLVRNGLEHKPTVAFTLLISVQDSGSLKIIAFLPLTQGALYPSHTKYPVACSSETSCHVVGKSASLIRPRKLLQAINTSDLYSGGFGSNLGRYTEYDFSE